MTNLSQAGPSVSEKSSEEILSAVRSLESTYKDLPTSIESDHRRHLRCDELEHILHLVQEVARIRGRSPETGPIN